MAWTSTHVASVYPTDKNIYATNISPGAKLHKCITLYLLFT